MNPWSNGFCGTTKKLFFIDLAPPTLIDIVFKQLEQSMRSVANSLVPNLVMTWRAVMTHRCCPNGLGFRTLQRKYEDSSKVGRWGGGAASGLA